MDNLQINFSNIHIRIEDFSISPPISFGFTLQSLCVINTNEDWEPIFIDRNIHKETNLYKLLKLSNFGFFLNLNEKLNLSNFQSIDLIENKMNDLFSDKSERVHEYNYLIKPSK